MSQVTAGVSGLRSALCTAVRVGRPSAACTVSCQSDADWQRPLVDRIFGWPLVKDLGYGGTRSAILTTRANQDEQTRLRL